MTKSTTTRRFRSISLVVVAAGALLVGACSSDDSASTTTAKQTTTTAGSAETAATVRFDKGIQTKLQQVGCYTGAVDGVLGPETDAAILEFQKASGLAADGELGPKTETQLSKDAAAGTKVCGATPSTTAKGSTTTTPNGSEAPCTATAITASLESGQTPTSYVCADGWAAGGWTNGQADGAFILKSESGKWAKPAQDPCGSASAGLPPVILEDGCAS